MADVGVALNEHQQEYCRHDSVNFFADNLSKVIFYKRITITIRLHKCNLYETILYYQIRSIYPCIQFKILARAQFI